jgi:hypothetical protein
VGIAHGHLDIGVAQELLDRFQADASHDKVGSEGVPEVVKAEIIDSSLPTGGGEGSLYGIEPAASPSQNT